MNADDRAERRDHSPPLRGRAPISLGWAKALVLFPLSIPLLSPLYGANRAVRGYFDTGRREVFDDFDDEGIDDEYTYRNTHLRFEDAGFDRVSYEVSTFQKSRDYKDTNDLDNRAETYHGKAAYTFPTTNPLVAGLELRNKNKRFENAPDKEFVQNMITPSITKSRKGLYRLNVETSLNDIRYRHAGEKDAITWVGRINGNRYFNGGKVNLLSSYSLARTEKKEAFRMRTKQEWMGKGIYKFDSPWIDKAAIRTNAGQRDTKEDEDFDIDYDYRYWGLHGETSHSIGPDTEVSLEYNFLDKNYLAYNRDHTEYSFANEWKRTFIRDQKARAWASITVGHKEAHFPELTGNNLKKETVDLKAVYWRKKNWTATVLGEAAFYDFNNSQKDKNRFNTSAEWNKDLMDDAMDLTLGVKFGHTDYREKNNTERASFRLAFASKF